MVKLIALIIPLGLDTFVVATALGSGGLPATRRLRVALLFTAFEAGMPLIGLGLGASLSSIIGSRPSLRQSRYFWPSASTCSWSKTRNLSR